MIVILKMMIERSNLTRIHDIVEHVAKFCLSLTTEMVVINVTKKHFQLKYMISRYKEINLIILVSWAFLVHIKILTS